MKDQTLNVTYLCGDDGQLYVFMYRGKLHIGTVEVNSHNRMTVVRGIENTAPIFTQYLPVQKAVSMLSAQVLYCRDCVFWCGRCSEPTMQGRRSVGRVASSDACDNFKQSRRR